MLGSLTFRKLNLTHNTMKVSKIIAHSHAGGTQYNIRAPSSPHTENGDHRSAGKGATSYLGRIKCFFYEVQFIQLTGPA